MSPKRPIAKPSAKMSKDAIALALNRLEEGSGSGSGWSTVEEEEVAVTPPPTTPDR